MKKKEMHWGLLSRYRQELMGVAGIWILLSHYLFTWPESLYIVKRICDYGNAGVEMFLIVSGVGLYYSYSKSKSLPQFYIRRLVRLLIPYVLIAVPFWVWRDAIGYGNFWMDLSCLSLPLKGTVVLWYIPTIAVFYLAFPLVDYWIHRDNALRLKWSSETKTVAMCIVAFVCLLVFMRVFPGIYNNCEIGLTRCIIFVVGCYLGKVVAEKRKIEGYWVLLCVALSSGFILLREMVSVQGFWYRILYGPFGLAVTVVAAWLLDRVRVPGFHKVLRFFGERSIEIYMVHITLRSVYQYYFPKGLFDANGYLAYILFIVVSVAISAAVHPLIKWLTKMLLREK